MKVRLIVNSDDYGRSAEISRGVREAHQRGIVTSTTAMMNFPTAAADIIIAQSETPRLGIGVHLVLTSGRPILPAERVPSLVDANGVFHSARAIVAKRHELKIEEVRAEWTAQIERYVVAAGRMPTHLDSHHHSSYFSEALFQTMLELAQQVGNTIRLPMVLGRPESMTGFPSEILGPLQEYAPRLLSSFKPRRADMFYSTFYDETATVDNLLSIIQNLEEGVNELMCHPGYVDSDLAASSVYNRQRETELGVLTDPRVRAAIQQRGIELINFDAI